MPVYFDFPVKYHKYSSSQRGEIFIGDRDIMAVDPSVKPGTYRGWHSDLSIVMIPGILDDRLYPMLVADDADDETYVVLSVRRDFGGFDREWIVMPDGQRPLGCRTVANIYVDNCFYDVLILATWRDRMYCTVGRGSYRLLVMLGDGVYAKEFRDKSELPKIIDELNAHHESRAWSFLEEANFGNQSWHDISML